MSVGIDELFDMLSWNSDEETQRRGIELAREVKCLSVFIRPIGLNHGKDIWENCAKVITSYPDEILFYCIPGMLEWLSDMNFPGAEIIFERLLKYQDSKSLAYRLEPLVKQAMAWDDQFWLSNMAALLENENLKDYLQRDIYNSLCSRYVPEEKSLQ